MMTMRKLLLGTTALIGAGVLGAAALPGSAGAAEVKPGGALDVTISGFARFRAHGGDLDNQRNNDAISTGLDFSNDTEVHVILRGKHDATGIEYGGTVEFEADTNRTDNTDETWLFVSGGFGELRFGDEDGAVDNSSIGAYTIAAGTGGIDGSIVDVLAISPVRPTNSDDATKIRYYTPSLGGFQVGISYTPNATIVGDGDALGVNGDGLAFKDVDIGDWVEGALVYEGDLAGLGLQASLVGSIADVKNEDALGGDDDAWAYYGGVTTNIFGFKLGGGFGDEEFGGLEKTYYNAGVGASLGPANVSLNYGQIVDSDGYAGDEPYNVILSADVGLMPGLVLAGDVAYFNNDVEDDDDLNTGDDDGYVYVVRLGLAF
jgi:outer membrane protein OmpU